MFMVMLILNDVEQCQNVLDAWDETGVAGVTVLPSTGLGRIRARMGLKEDMPLMPSLDDFFHQEESVHRTLISIVRDRPLIDKLIQATESVLGDLNRPNTGILVIMPVIEAYGLDRYKD